MMFETDEYLEMGMHKDAGFMLLNILGYIRDEGLECEPESSRVYRTVVPPPSSTSPDDWSL